MKSLIMKVCHDGRPYIMTRKLHNSSKISLNFPSLLPQSLLNSMIITWLAKQTKSSFRTYSYHTSPRPHRPRSRHAQSHKPTKSQLRTPIPFLTDLKHTQYPDESLSLFDDYRRTGFKHDYPSYSSLLYRLARSRHFEAVETILRQVRDYNIRCKEALFVGLIKHYGHSQLPDKAVELFCRMPEFNCVRTLQSFNTILNVLVENGRFRDALEMIKGCSKMGFRPNAVTFNILIKGWLEKDGWEEALQVFDEMLEREVEPTVVTYNCLIGFWCKKAEFDKAKGLFEVMIQKGKRPNAVTFALLMECLCCLGKFKEAKKMMFDMEYLGCKPRLVNYGVLMNHLASKWDIDEAKALFLELKKRRIKPDVVMYNILINYLCKERRVSEAYQILVEMQVQGIEANAITYRMVVDGFCRIGEFGEALKVLNVMLTSRHCVRLETFCRLLVGLVNNRRMNDACFVLEEMEKRKMSPDSVSWDALVKDACGKDSNVNGIVANLVSAS